MAFLGKEYTLQSQENFDGFLKSNGLPEDKIKALVAEKGTFKIVKNGDSYVMTNTSTNKPQDVTFKSGVEFDDVIGPASTPVKTTITVDGNVVTQTLKTDQGSATIKREFNGNDLVVTITSDNFDGVAKRYYKA